MTKESNELMSELINVSERRQFRRVFSLVPQEDVVLFSMNGRNHFVAKLLDLSRGGALIYTADPSVSADAGSHYKLYFQSRGAMFHLEALLEIQLDRKSTRLNSSHEWISYAVFCLKKKKRVH